MRRPTSSEVSADPRTIALKFSSDRYAILGLLATVIALVLALLATSTPAARDAAAPADQFAVGRALPLLERLVGDGRPHPMGTPAHAETQDRVISELQALGLEVDTQTSMSCVAPFAVCGEVVNVMARLPGRTEGPAVLLTAHYDSVGAGPGVSDDLVGVAAIIETARLLLADGPLRNPFILLFTDGEEVGLLGAEAFVDHPWFPEVGVVVNVEARGTSGQSLMFETNTGNAWLIDAFARQAPRPATSSLLYEIYRLLPNDTDFTIYKDAGLNGMNFGYVGDVAHYHTPLDDLSHLDPGSFQHQGDNILAAARGLGEEDLLAPPMGNAIYMDVVPGSVLRVPESWAIPSAAACLLAWFLLVAVLLRRRALTFGRVLLGVFAALLSLGVAAVLVYFVTSAVQALTGLAQPWYASPVPTRVAVWLAVLFGSVAMTALFSRWLGFWGLAVGAWLVWALATVATALTLPGVSIVFLVPLVCATILYMVALVFGGRSTTDDKRVGPVVAVAALLATFATAYVWLPFALSIEMAVGMALSAAVALGLGLSFLTLTPLLAVASRRTPTPQPALLSTATRPRRLPLRAAVLLSSVIGVVFAGFLASRAPTFTEQSPQRFSIWHVQDSSAGAAASASWLLDRDPDAPLPPAFATFGEFTSSAATTLPSGPDWYRYAPAPTRTVTPPSIEVVSDESIGTSRVLRLRLDPGEGSDWLTLAVPRSVSPARLTVDGVDDEIRLVGGASWTPDVANFRCYGPACDGLEVELRVETLEGFELTILAHTYGLPESGAALQAARPSTAAPSQDGDVSVVFARVAIP